MHLTDEERINNLKEVLESYVPDSNSDYAYKKIDEMYDNQATAKDFVIALSDGLRYGNWPWTNYNNPEENKRICRECGVTLLNGKLPVIEIICAPCKSAEFDK